MDCTSAHVPQICISPAPPEEPAVEPYSPFSFLVTTSDSNTFRPQHLTPPPTLTSFGKQLSPLRPSYDITPAKELERERFEALLQASRERNAAVGTKKVGNLRREIALKAHRNKQVERRALFLSKVSAPPSPTATSTPKTPPDSPAIFHYSLPSPGLVSPLALFESLSENPTYGPFSYNREPWVEQVDFRVPEYNKRKEYHGSPESVPCWPLPSLDQISAHLNRGIARLPGPEASGATRSARLPAFLAPRLPTAAGGELVVSRSPLRIPARASKPELLSLSPPTSPMSPNIQVTTLIIPRSATVSSTKLSKSNLMSSDSRERRAQDMLSTLRRRTSPETEVMDDRKSKWKRHSAPADLMPLRSRSGFEHPVLALSGGF